MKKQPAKKNPPEKTLLLAFDRYARKMICEEITVSARNFVEETYNRLYRELETGKMAYGPGGRPLYILCYKSPELFGKPDLGRYTFVFPRADVFDPPNAGKVCCLDVTLLPGAKPVFDYRISGEGDFFKNGREISFEALPPLLSRAALKTYEALWGLCP